MNTASAIQRPVIYYQGSFDPAHEGHVSALQAAMEKTQAASAIIVVDNAPNPHKPNRSSWEIRKEIAVRTFGHLENVSVSPLPKEETKQKILSNHSVINLIGSDVWPLYSERKKIPFYGICINLRDAESTTYPKTLAGKEITCVTPTVQGCSSSKIRKYLKSHTELYEGAPIEKESILTKLSPASLEFILENKLYFPTQKEKIEQTIENYASIHLFKDKPFSILCLTDTFDEHRKFGGLSGDLTFCCISDKEKVFIKVYTRPTHLQNSKNEIEGMKLLNSLSLCFTKAISPIHLETFSGYSCVYLPFIDKPDLAKVFKNILSSKDEEKFIQMCFYAGRALGELHHKKSHPVEKEKLKEITGLLSQRTFPRIAKLPQDLQNRFKSAYISSLEDFLNNPGMHTFALGDANLSNFIVDESEETVYMIDLECLFTEKSNLGDPLGFPAEDYYRFLGGISWLNEEKVTSSSVINAAQEAFKKGYATFPSTLTPEAHRYFSNYWRIRNYKFDLVEPT